MSWRTTMRSFLAVFTAALILGTTAGSAPAGAAGPTGAAPRSCPRGVLFCEDFERLPRGGPSTLNWGVDTRTAPSPWSVPATATGPAHTHGRQRTRLPAGGRLRGARQPFLRPDAAARRAFPTAPDWAHFTLVEATGTDSSEVVRPIGGQYAPTVPGTSGGWARTAARPATGPTGGSPPRSPRTRGSASSGDRPHGQQVAVWIDGVANPELTASTRPTEATTSPSCCRRSTP